METKSKTAVVTFSIPWFQNEALAEYCRRNNFGLSAALQQILYEKFKKNPKPVFEKATRFFEAKQLVAGERTTQRSSDNG